MKCEGEFVMDANVINELQNGLSAAYIDGAVAANLAYKPAFVSNNPEDGKRLFRRSKMNCYIVRNFRLVLHLSRWEV